MPYEQRFMVRPLFIALDVFLVYVGNAKNEARRRGRNKSDITDIEARIAQLKSEYERSFAVVRDKIVAHRQRGSLLTLFEHWVSVDQVAAVVLRDDMVDIYNRLADSASGGTHRGTRSARTRRCSASIRGGCKRGWGTVGSTRPCSTSTWRLRGCVRCRPSFVQSRALTIRISGSSTCSGCDRP
jgi:hypothetical protein